MMATLSFLMWVLNTETTPVTLPDASVNGKFSARQAEVAMPFYAYMRESISMLRPGIMLDDYHKKVGDLMTNELLTLGLITSDEVAKEDPAWPAYKKYYTVQVITGTGWYTITEPWTISVEEGMVFTVGQIYIPEGLGIRIEDDIVVTKEDKNPN